MLLCQFVQGFGNIKMFFPQPPLLLGELLLQSGDVVCARRPCGQRGVRRNKSPKNSTPKRARKMFSAHVCHLPLIKPRPQEPPSP